LQHLDRRVAGDDFADVAVVSQRAGDELRVCRIVVDDENVDALHIARERLALCLVRDDDVVVVVCVRGLHHVLATVRGTACKRRA